MSDYKYGVWAQLAGLLRRLPVREIKRCLRLAKDHSLLISAAELEAHHLAGGRIGDLMDALIYAKEHGMVLSLTRAAAQDLARGREIRVSDWVRDCHLKGVQNLNGAGFS